MASQITSVTVAVTGARVSSSSSSFSNMSLVSRRLNYSHSSASMSVLPYTASQETFSAVL